MFEEEKSVLLMTKFFDQNKGTNRYLILYSFDGPFHDGLLHTDVANLEFVGKSVVNPKHCLLLVNLFSSKFFKYSMKKKDEKR